MFVLNTLCVYVYWCNKQCILVADVVVAVLWYVLVGVVVLCDKPHTFYPQY